MSNRESVGSLIASHRATAMRADRSVLLPQTGQLPSAAPFSRRRPQLRSLAPNSAPPVPDFPTPIPIFPATLPDAKAPVPIFRMAVPSCPTIFPNASASLPNFRRVFPNFPATFPHFPPATRNSKGLFPSHLRGLWSREGRAGCDDGPSLPFPPFATFAPVARPAFQLTTKH